MLNFEHISTLWLLLLIGPLVALFLLTWFWRRRARNRFGDPDLMQDLLPHFSGRRKMIRFVLILLAFVGVVLGLANLRMGSRKEIVQRKGADVEIAFDLSRSMLAEDVRPSRLSRAKLFASKLLKEIQGDKTGLVVFAGNAYLQMPMTVDASAAQLYLNILDTDAVPRQGTAIGDAIQMAMEAFDQGAAEGSHEHRAIVVITDGETHKEEAIAKAAEAAEAGITIFTVGVGTTVGGPIPIPIGSGYNYKKDRSGNIILSKLNEDMLRDVAEAGGGEYFHISGGNQAIRDIGRLLTELEKETGESYTYTAYRKHFQVFLAIALGLLLMEFMISDRRAGWLQRLQPFDS